MQNMTSAEIIILCFLIFFGLFLLLIYDRCYSCGKLFALRKTGTILTELNSTKVEGEYRCVYCGALTWKIIAEGDSLLKRLSEKKIGGPK